MSDGLGWTLLTTGGILLYAGAKGYSVPDVLRNVITGRPITENVKQNTPLGASGEVTPQDVPNNSGTMGSAAGGVAVTNQNIAQPLAAQYGWGTGEQWDALLILWTKESSWDNHANNASSGAYGIPQALPYTKMPKTAWPESAGGQSSPEAQIRWGLNYIAGRYGLPQFALAFHRQNNWY